MEVGPSGGEGMPDLEQLKALLETYQQTGGRRLGPVPEELQELLDNYNRDQGRPVEQVEGQDITPKPGFVVKTSDTPTGVKVFINICSDPAIPEPGGWSQGSLPDHVLQSLEQAASAQELAGQALEALRLPLSCSEPRGDVDKKGEPCLVLDCIFNPMVLEAGSRMRHFKSFLVSLVLDAAAGKGKLELDARFKLPKMSYKGDTVLTQRVRKERKPLVTDMGDMFEEPSFPLLTAKPKQPAAGAAAGGKHTGSSGAAAAAGGAALSSSSSGSQAAAPAAAAAGGQGPPGSSSGRNGAQQQQQQMTYTLSTSGKPVQQVEVEVQIPAAQLQQLAGSPTNSSSSSSGAGGVEVRLQGLQLTVTAPGCTPLAVPLPFYVDLAAAAARLVAARGVLQVVLPYAPLAAYLAGVVAAAPVAAGSLPVDHSSYMELDE